jgi:predicted alpha/beta-hydrolase family hydrolase
VTSTAGSTAGAEWRVEVGADAATSAIFEPALADPLGVLFVCAHGAGGHMNDRGMLASAGHLRRRGFDVVRFNFLYRENGTSRPDPMPRLEQCIVAVASRAREETGVGMLVLGGRSMGGRAASMLAAAGEFACDGLLLLAYPLHPAGQPEKLRATHLARIKVPVLCLNGTRDALCQRELMERAVGHLDGWTMHWLEGADHGFHVLKRSGRSDDEVLGEIAEVSRAWAARLRQGTGGPRAAHSA